MIHEIDEDLALRMVGMSNLAGLVDLEGRHVGTSVLSALHVASDVASNPIAHALVVYICVFCNQCFVVIKVIIELVWIFFAQTNGADLDE